MFSGIVFGAVSALFMSTSYIFSRIYIRKYTDPLQLTIHSLFVMGFWGAILLGASTFFLEFPWGTKFLLLVAAETLFFIVSQTCFFMLLKNLEASRASSLLGLKIMAICLLTACMGKFPSLLQALAILLCTVAAVGMNFSGGKLSLKSISWLACAVFFYAVCDICLTEIMALMNKDQSMLLNALGAMGVCYTALGLASLPFLKKYPLSKRCILDVVPYSFFYFFSILFLLVCFGFLGVVFGSIIQAGRGIISVLLGVILLKLGVEKNEPSVPGRVWVRRFIMALLMLCAMTLYSVSSAR